MQIVKKPSEYMLLIIGLLFPGDSWKSGAVHTQLINDMGNKHPSRASVINFLNLLVESGYVEYETRTGKGGYHRVYTLKGTKEDFLTKLQLEQTEQFLETWMEPLGAFE